MLAQRLVTGGGRGTKGKKGKCKKAEISGLWMQIKKAEISGLIWIHIIFLLNFGLV